MKYVLDSNVALKWVLPETDDDKAIRIRDEFGQGIHQLLSPAVTVLAEYQCTELPARNIRRWPNYRLSARPIQDREHRVLRDPWRSIAALVKHESRRSLIQLAGGWPVGLDRGNLMRPRSSEASNLERPDSSRLDIDHANLVIVRVGHIQVVSSHAQTAGLIEAGRIVLAAGLAVAGERLDCLGSGVANLDLVVVGIGDEELAAAVGQDEAVLEANVCAGTVDVA